MAVFIALASIADITQNALFGGTGRVTGRAGRCRAAWQAYPVLWIPLRGGRYDIGPLDLLLFTAIGEHRRRRRADRRMVLTAGGRGCHGAAVERRTTPQPPPGQRPAPRPLGPSGCQTGRPPPGSSLPSSRGGLATSCSPWQDRAADADRAKRSRPAAREKGSRLPGQATPAVGLGQPGILSAHHSNLLHARQPARHRPRRHAGIPDLGGQRPQPQPSRLPRRTCAYASSDDCRVGCGLRSAGAQGTARGLSGVQRLGARLADGRCPPQSWRTTMRSSRRPLRTLPAAP